MLITHIAHKHLNRAVYEKGGDGGYHDVLNLAFA